MFKTILVPLTGQPSDKSLLESAYAYARDASSHVECLYVRADARQFAINIATDNMGVPVVTPELMAAIEEQDRVQCAKTRAGFESFCKVRNITITDNPPAAEKITAAWHEECGDLTEAVIRRARLNDITILQRGTPLAFLSPESAGNVVIGSGRPVLLLPEAASDGALNTIAIAWKDAPEAARAVAAAMPVLEKARNVLVYSAVEDGNESFAKASAHDLVSVLRWHGLEAQAQCITPRGKTAAEEVILAAANASADLLVMGGYGHSRLRETVFGGFTRYVLHHDSLPVMLVH